MASIYEEYLIELNELCEVVRLAIDHILGSKDRLDKHPPYSWVDEPEDEHLRKAMRHILTHQLQRDGQQKSDGEDHLSLAITRLAMAEAKYQRSIK